MKIAYIGQKGIAIGKRGGGIEKHVFELSIRMAQKGHSVTVYARKRYAPNAPKEYAGVKLVYIPTIYRKNVETIVHTFLSTLHVMTKKYDIVHYHGVGPATLAWIPRLFKPKTRVVVTFHSQDRFHQKWGWFARNYLHFGEWAAVWFPNVCISVSHVIQVYARKIYRKQVVYIPNGAEVQNVKSDAHLKQFDIKKDEYILNVGRIVPQKGLQFLIEAYKRIRTEKKLVIVGAPSFSDRYFNELKRMAKGNKNIIFTGYQSGETLRQLFAHAYLYCQPSESEGLAVVVLEAMSFGTAVLVSDIPENLEAISNVGFSFANRDVDDLESQIQQLINHPELVSDYGKKAQAIVAKEFNWDVIADKVESVYISTRH